MDGTNAAVWYSLAAGLLLGTGLGAAAFAWLVEGRPWRAEAAGPSCERLHLDDAIELDDGDGVCTWGC